MSRNPRMSSSANRSMVASLCASLSLAALLAPLGAAAQSGGDDWKFRATIYGWFPNMDAKASFPTPQGSLVVDAGNILDSLQFAAMGTLEVRKGRWGAFTDLIYSDLSDSKTGARAFTVGAVNVPGNAILSADLSMKAWIWTLAGGYAVVQDPTHELNVFAGFRYLDVSNDLNWAFTGNVGPIPVPGRAGVASADATSWDGIVGVHGAAKLGGSGWYMPYYLDVGTGQSQLTWQALLGLGYEFKWGNAIAAYRYLDYDLSSGKPMADLSMYGPLLGVTFRF